ncbi:molybdopterin-dependent oxidoreductase [Xanthobacter sp. KR7-225]|uniref:molybdopterin-dependent oxidoreductase n=1 Tax=Xanthobacter sp. KR7-225 TaxID=3156613 RepID=UPI0032B3745D
MGVIIPGYCTLCRSRCGTLNEIDGDRFIAARPNPAHPTGKAMCMKGRAAPELVHSPHRVLHPMRRTNPKGAADPGWRRISWEEALSEVAARLGAVKAAHGAQAVAFAVTTPSGTPLSDSIDWIERFVRTFGSPNICYATEICNWHKDVAHAFTFGCGIPTADYENADTIMLWGHNPANTWLAQADAIARGRARGARLLVIDPRPTALARQADVWLPVRPGTDAALALGLMRLLLDAGRADEPFLRAWTNAPFLVRADTGHFLREQEVWPGAAANRYVVWSLGAGAPQPYDGETAMAAPAAADLRMEGTVEVSLAADGESRTVVCAPAFQHLREACSSFDPARVEAITGVPPDRLAAAADLLQAGRRVAYHAWTGIGQHANATQTERAVATLYALTGSFDRIGANRVRRGPFCRPVNALDKLPAIRDKALGYQDRPIGPPAMGWVTARDTYRAILDGAPYKVRAMVAFGTNLLVSQADCAMAAEALAALDFHVHCDLFETPSARYADIFLPVNSPWEHEGLRFGFEINDAAASLVQFRPRMVSPRGESRSDCEIVFDLAGRLGMGDQFFGGSLEAGWNHMLEPLGLSVDRLRRQPEGVRCEIDSRERKYARPHHDAPDRIRGFDTESRRVEIYSELLLRHGQPALAAFLAAPADARSGRAEENTFPLILTSAKNGYYCHSQHRALVSLRRRAPDPVAELSPALAAARGIQDGDWVRVATPVGAARFLAKLTPGLSDDVVVGEFGWWQACPELDRLELAIGDGSGSNFNDLISAARADPVSGATPMRSFRCDIGRDPLTPERQRRWPGWRPFRVVAVRPEAEGARSFVFAAEDGGLLPDFRPGQHVEIRLDIDGAPVARAYSLTGPATRAARDHYSICVRHLESRTADGALVEGRMSGHLHRRTRPGDRVELRAPSGSFVVPRAAPQPLVLVAAGIGITPFIALLDSLGDGDPLDITLFYANANSRTHAFKASIAAHRRRLPGLKVFDHYRRPLPEDVPGRDFDSADDITADLVRDALIARRPRIYMCASEAMMEPIARGLVARGVPAFDIFREVFASPAVVGLDDGRRCTVTFAASQRRPELWSAAEGPLLAFGEKLGIALPSGCRVGQCESCAVRIVSGKVAHLHGREPDDPACCLTCQAIPIEDLVLEA